MSSYVLGLSSEPINKIPAPCFNEVGLIRSEYLCKYRREYITQPSCQKYITEYVTHLCKLFYPNDIWYRTTDFIDPELNLLKGSTSFINEKYYLMGLRGIRRGMANKKDFLLELNTIIEIAKNFSNLNILFPFIKDAYELEVCLGILNKLKYNNKYGIMLEIPSIVYLLQDMLSLGVSNVTMGMNDLTTFILGSHRSSDYFNNNNPAVLNYIYKISNSIKNSKNNCISAIAGNLNTNLIKFAIKSNIDKIVIHYHDIPRLIGGDFDDLKYTNRVHDIQKSFKKLRNKGK
jgi:phosphoenolpyruvate-protein kinase (PTS system EI component)